MFARILFQFYIKYKAYCDKKASASKLEERYYVYVFQPTAEHQGTKNPFTDLRWTLTYMVEKTLPTNNYFVRKIGTHKTKELHHLRLRQFTPGLPMPNVKTTPQH